MQLLNVRKLPEAMETRKRISEASEAMETGKRISEDPAQLAVHL